MDKSMQQLRVYLGFPVGLERVLEEEKNLLVPARGGTVMRGLRWSLSLMYSGEAGHLCPAFGGSTARGGWVV